MADKGGRPTLFREEYVEIGSLLKSRGYTDAMIAEVLRVSDRTVCAWKRQHPEFLRLTNFDIAERFEPVDPHEPGEALSSAMEVYDLDEVGPDRTTQLISGDGGALIERRRPPSRAIL